MSNGIWATRDQSPADCNTANVVGQALTLRARVVAWAYRSARKLRADADGAIMVIIAVFAGAGVLLAVLAMGVEAGRVYMMRSQVQAAADSAILALAEQCKSSGHGVTTQCTSATALFALAKRSAEENGTNGITLVGVCVDTGTSGTLKCATNTTGPDLTTPGTLDDRCSALPASTEAYVQVIAERTVGFSGLFMPDSKHRQCAQARWSAGFFQSTPLPFVFPVCAGAGVPGYVDSGTVLLLENPSQGGGSGSRNGQACTVTWQSSNSQSFGFAPTTVSSVDSSLSAYSGLLCGDSVQLQLGSVLTMGELIQDTCANGTRLSSWLNGAARYVPIGGDYIGTTWNVKLEAFAKFQLLGLNPASSASWSARSGVTLPSSVTSKCLSPNKLTCVYGQWVGGTLQFAGNVSSSDGIELLQ